jgi:uncharacterized protein YndB with AHSA1/START domain/uncharacterized protein YciI
MSSQRSARVLADVNGGIILAEVEIAAPPERVFRALTQSDEIVRWWGSPDAYRTESWTADLRVGGSWKADGRGSDGASFTVGGVFLEVDPPRRLVQTWKSDWDPGETTLTYQLVASDGGTRLTLRHEGFAEAESCEDHARGWEAVLGWLSRHFAQPAAEPDQSFYLIRLLPPRPSFAFDMTPAEAAVMQKHVAYWTELLRAGNAIVFGPVADPSGSWGLGVVRVATEERVRAIEAGDPAVQSGMRYEILPMIQAVVKA